MKNILVIALLLLGSIAAFAQSTNIVNQFGSSTNWVVLPYGSYDIQKKVFGYGGAFLYKASDNFWAGFRAESIADRQFTAGVQGQLQVPFHVSSFTVIPFIETSVGLGKSSLYGSVGPGASILFYSVNWPHANLTIGTAADYEHYVNGSGNGDQVNAGLLLLLNF